MQYFAMCDRFYVCVYVNTYWHVNVCEKIDKNGYLAEKS